MIQIIGTENCNRCETVKNILKEKNIGFEYTLISELNNQDEILNMAKENGFTNYPLIFTDGKMIDLQEVLN